MRLLKERMLQKTTVRRTEAPKIEGEEAIEDKKEDVPYSCGVVID